MLVARDDHVSASGWPRNVNDVSWNKASGRLRPAGLDRGKACRVETHSPNVPGADVGNPTVNLHGGLKPVLE